MLGRVRGCSLSSLQVLELERTPPPPTPHATHHPNHHHKLLKHDSLSVYEKTLLKLQQGSQRHAPDESTNTGAGPSMAPILSNQPSLPVSASDCAPTGSFPSTESTNISKDKPNGNLSILYMFSRYKTCKNNNKSSCDDGTMEMEDSADTSPHGCIVDPPSPI